MSRPHDPAIPEPQNAGQTGRTSGCRISIGGAIHGIHLSAAAGFLVRTVTEQPRHCAAAAAHLPSANGTLTSHGKERNESARFRAA
jgi:hypothetical protein